MSRLGPPAALRLRSGAASAQVAAPLVLVSGGGMPAIDLTPTAEAGARLAVLTRARGGQELPVTVRGTEIMRPVPRGALEAGRVFGTDGGPAELRRIRSVLAGQVPCGAP